MVGASFLGCREPALIPAFSPRRRGIVVRWFVTANDYSRFMVPMHATGRKGAFYEPFLAPRTTQFGEKYAQNGVV
jgi:hypothetical protein